MKVNLQERIYVSLLLYPCRLACARVGVRVCVSKRERERERERKRERENASASKINVLWWGVKVGRGDIIKHQHNAKTC